MTTAEITAYNEGCAVAAELTVMKKEGRLDDMPTRAVLSLEGTLALRKLGQERFFAMFRQGANDTLYVNGVV